MNRLFNLPTDILRMIYEYDSTYKYLMTNILKTELNEKVFDNYYKRLLKLNDGEYIAYLIKDSLESIKRAPYILIFITDINFISCSNNHYICMITNERFDYYILYEEDVNRGYGNIDNAIKYNGRYLMRFG